MDMTTYIPQMTPYVTVSLPIMPLLFMVIGMYLCFSIRRRSDERADPYGKEDERLLQEKEREIRSLREEISRLQEQMREKEKEHHRMVQSFTDHILSLSGNKMKSEEGLQQTTHALQETFQQTTHTFKDAIEQMKSQHSALMETQGQQIQSLKEEIRTVQNKVATVEKIMTCAIHFIRNRVTVYQDFIESEGYVVKALECEYPHLSFKRLALPAPSASAPSASLMPALLAPSAPSAPLMIADVPNPVVIKPVKKVRPPMIAKPIILSQE